MEALTQEISRKKLEIESAKTGRFLKRSDINADCKVVKKAKSETILSREDDINADCKVVKKAKSETILSREDVIFHLRRICQPVTLFGETDSDRLKRFEAISSKEDTMGSGSGLFKPKPLDIESADKYSEIKNKDQFQCSEDWVLYFLKQLIYEWNLTSSNSQAFLISQTREYMKPFFRMLKTRKCPADILDRVLKIVDFCHEREYVQANSMYLELSIGNATWPIGVISVGIHERAGDAKIHSDKVAHIFNDDKARKYIQSIKRLMTFCQKQRPNSMANKNIG